MELFTQKKSKDLDLRKNRTRRVDYVNPIVFGNSQSYDVVLLLDEYYPNFIINRLRTWVQQSVDVYVDVMILYPFEYKIKKSDVKKIVKFYADSAINLEDYIKPYSKVISVGKSLYSITKSDDLDIQGFYDIVFHNNSFWSSDLKSRIFPVDNAWSLFKKIGVEWEDRDCWEKYFFMHQCKSAYDFDVPRVRIPKLYSELVENPNEFLKEHKDRECLMAWDTETRGMDPFNLDHEIICITLSFDGKTGYYLRWKDINKDLFGDFLNTKKSIGQNIKYDIKFVTQRGVDVNKVHIHHDTWNGSHCINEMQRSSLKSDTWLYTYHGGYDRPLDNYLKKYPEAKKDFGLIPEPILFEYATMDAIVNFQIYEEQLNKFKWIDNKFPMDNGWSLERYYYETHIPAINLFLAIELEGMYIDWELLKRNIKPTQEEISNLKLKIFNSFGVEPDVINLDSNNELAVFLESQGWSKQGRSKVKPRKNLANLFRSKFNYEIDFNKGIYFVGDNELEKWKKEGHKEAELLQEYRELRKLMKTYVGEDSASGFFKYRKSDDKIHPTFGPMLANSQRNWCRNPNLQNIPKHGDRSIWYRKIFIPPSPDYFIDEKDAAGFQLRIGAIYSQDPELIKVFTELGGDLHSMTAQSVLRRDLTFDEFIELRKKGDHDIEEARFKAKKINFQLEFGASAYNFAVSIIEKEWSRKEVQEYVTDNNLQPMVDRMYGITQGKEAPTDSIDPLDKPREDIFSHIVDKKHFSKCWAVASDIRRKYFETYNLLHKWIKNTEKEADRNGFVRSPFGCIRRLPQLLYQGKDDSRIKIKNWHNMSVNSPVQNYENVLMIWTGYGTLQYIREHNLKSRICGNVHDAIVYYTHKDEFKELDAAAKKIFEEDRPENKGIPLELEYNIADYYKNGDVWGFGKEDIEEV